MLGSPEEPLKRPFPSVSSGPQESNGPRGKSKFRRPKPVPFKKEQEAADARKEEAEAHHKATEEANRQKQQKAEERENHRKAMAKARTGGKNGQRKLGRESKVLLEKVKRIVSK